MSEREIDSDVEEVSALIKAIRDQPWHITRAPVKYELRRLLPCVRKVEPYGPPYEVIEVPGGEPPRFIVVIRGGVRLGDICELLGPVRELAGAPVVRLEDGEELELYAVTA